MISISSLLKRCVNHKRLKIFLIGCKKAANIPNKTKINRLIFQILVPLTKINNLDKNLLLLKCLTNPKSSLFVSLINDHKFNTSKKVPETYNKFLIFTVKMKASNFRDPCHLTNKVKTTQDLTD